MAMEKKVYYLMWNTYMSKNKSCVRCAGVASRRKWRRFCVPCVPCVLTPVATLTRILAIWCWHATPHWILTRRRVRPMSGPRPSYSLS